MPANRTDDLKTAGVVGMTVPLKVHTTNPTSVAVDMINSQGYVQFIVVNGIIGASSTQSYAFEESVDGTNNWTAISGLSAYAAAADADDTVFVTPVAERTKRYVRATLTVGGTPSAGGTAIVVSHSMQC